MKVCGAVNIATFAMHGAPRGTRPKYLSDNLPPPPPLIPTFLKTCMVRINRDVIPRINNTTNSEMQIARKIKLWSNNPSLMHSAVIVQPFDNLFTFISKVST